MGTLERPSSFKGTIHGHSQQATDALQKPIWACPSLDNSSRVSAPSSSSSGGSG